MSFYIALEGIDGSGKTTQCNSLATHFKELGFSVFQGREPWEFDSGNITSFKSNYPARSIKDRLLLMDKLESLMLSFDFLIMDRCFMSTMVYHSTDIYTMQHILLDNSNCIFPDLILLLDIDPIDSVERDQKASFIARMRTLRNKYYKAAGILGPLVAIVDTRNLNEEQAFDETLTTVHEHITKQYLRIKDT